MFVAVRVDEGAVVQRLLGAQRRLVPEERRGDSINPIKFHITMAVLCAEREEDVVRALSAVRDVERQLEPFCVTLRGVERFGNGRVLYAGVGEGLDRLAALAGSIRGALPQDLLLEKDRAFQAHCTLWKSKKAKLALPNDGTDWAREEFGVVKVGSLELVRMANVDPHDGFYLAARREFFMLSELPDEERMRLLDQIHRLESVSFPEDEAASRENLEKRMRNCPQLFLVAMRDNQVYGFVNGTAANSAIGLTHDAMSTHDPEGDLCCIHGLVVDPALRRRGLAGRLMRYYLRAVRLRKFKLLCKEPLVGFYQRCGFVHLGPSAVVHGKEVWHDMDLLQRD